MKLEYLLIFVWYSCNNCLGIFVVLMIQISQQPLKLTVLPPLNYKQDCLLDIFSSALSKSFFIVLLVQLLTRFSALAPCSGQAFVTGMIRNTCAKKAISLNSSISAYFLTICFKLHSAEVLFNSVLLLLSCDLKLNHFFFNVAISYLKSFHWCLRLLAFLMLFL